MLSILLSLPDFGLQMVKHRGVFLLPLDDWTFDIKGPIIIVLQFLRHYFQVFALTITYVLHMFVQENINLLTFCSFVDILNDFKQQFYLFFNFYDGKI